MQGTKHVLIILILLINFSVSSIAFALSPLKDNKQQAQLHYELAEQHKQNKEYDKTVAELRQAIKLEPKNHIFLGNLGWVLLLVGDYEESRKASALAFSLEPGVMAWRLNLGHAHLMLGDFDKARRQYKATLSLIHNQAIFDATVKVDFELFIKNGWRVEASRRELAWMSDQIKAYWVIKEAFKRSAALYVNGKKDHAVDQYHKQLDLYRLLVDENNIDLAYRITVLARTYYKIVRFFEAESLYREALEIRRKTLPAKHPDIAMSLNNLAELFHKTGRYLEAEPLLREALETRQKALPVDHPYIALSMDNLASSLKNTGQYAEAEALYREALIIFKKKLSAVHPDIAVNLNSLGSLLLATGRYAEAEPLFRGALEIRQKALPEGHLDIASSMDSLALFFETTGRYAEAEPLYHEALAISKKALPVGHPDIARSMNNLALLYKSTGRYSEAKPLLREAMMIFKKALPEGHPDIAAVLNNLASLHEATGSYGEAELLYLEAYLIAINTEKPELKWAVQGNQMGFYRAEDHTELAIFYGKQAINTIQKSRQINRKVVKGTRESFLKMVEIYYKELANLLIKEGRLSEAQQVLAMLKEQEYSAFLRRNAKVDPRTTEISFTKTEQIWFDRYDEISNRLHTIAPELRLLRKKKKQGDLSALEQQRIDELKKDRTFATQKFKQYLDQLKTEFAQVGGDKQQEFSAKNLTQLTAMQSTLDELGSGTLLIHYLVTEEKIHILLTSPKVLLHREVTIKETELNRLIFEYRTTLQNPNLNPLIKAKKLYQYLIEPIAQDLKNLNAKVLMVSLDGSLRYLPLSALHDGEQWLIEQYATVIFTEASKAVLTNKRKGKWRIAGLGVSEGAAGLSPLPQVKQELNDIVKLDDKADKGVLPGIIRLNKDFTAEEFSELLDQEEPYQVIHLASHFVLRPGAEIESYLLLGNGETLTLAEFNNGNYPLTNVDMLTLSACNTAVGRIDANGEEVEGFGVLAQKLGAKSVLATLWSVEDKSTGQFMTQMYTARESKGLNKIEAIRQTQLAMIAGQIKPSSEELVATRGEQTVSRMWLGEEYSHPYFWAPFILMGNWL